MSLNPPSLFFSFLDFYDFVYTLWAVAFITFHSFYQRFHFLCLVSFGFALLPALSLFPPGFLPDVFLVFLAGTKTHSKPCTYFRGGRTRLVDCGLHWGELVASQLFWEGSKRLFPEASHCREDSPSSCPSCDGSGGGGGGSCSVSPGQDPLWFCLWRMTSIPGLLGVAVQVRKGGTGESDCSYTGLPPALFFLVCPLPLSPFLNIWCL